MIYLATLAVEYMPPAGMDTNVLAPVMYIAVFIAAVSHVIKLWLPKPPMEEQLITLERRLMERMDQQDEDAVARISELRKHIDAEVHRVHERIDSQGRELYLLKGQFDGWRSK